MIRRKANMLNINNRLYTKVISVFLLIAFPLLFLFLSPQNSEQKIDRKLKVGYVSVKPSMYLNEDGIVKGLFAEIFEYVANEENWEYEYYENHIWDELYKMLLKGDIDILIGIAENEERKKEIIFPRENWRKSWSEVLVNEESNISSILDLKDKKIASLKGSISTNGKDGIIEVLKKYKVNAEIVLMDDFDSMNKSLESGEVDAAVYGRPIAINFAAEKQFKQSGIVLAPTNVKIGISILAPDAQLIADLVDKNILKLIKDRTSIYYQNFDENLILNRDTISFIPIWLNWVLYIGGFLLIVVVANSIFLNLKVKEKTANLNKTNEILSKANVILVKNFKEIKNNEADLLQKAEMIDQVKDAMILVDMDGFIISWGKGSERMLGYTEEECLGKHISIIYSENDQNKIKELIIDPVIKNGYYELEEVLLKKSKESFYAHTSLSLIKDRDGIITGILGYSTDISIRKKNEEELNRLSIGIKQTYDAVMITDKYGSIQYVNPAFEKLSGYTMNEVRDIQPSILQSGKHTQDFYKNLWDTINSGMIWKGVMINKKKNGDLYHEDQTITPIKNSKGEIINFVSIKRDITSTKELEENLSQIRKEYDSFMRHELGNMLTPPMANTEMLLSFNSKGLSPEQYSTIEEVYNGLKKVTNFIEEVKKIQLFEFGKVKLYFTNIDIGYVIKLIVDEVNKLEKNIGIVVKLDDKSENIHVKADLNYIPGVFKNLIKYAVEHVRNVPDNNEKIVRIKIYNVDNEQHIGINFKGRQLSLIELESFFEKFIPNRGVIKDSVSLGTSYAKNVIVKHGGEVNVVSSEKEGNTVTVIMEIRSEEIN